MKDEGRCMKVLNDLFHVCPEAVITALAEFAEKHDPPRCGETDFPFSRAVVKLLEISRPEWPLARAQAECVLAYHLEASRPEEAKGLYRRAFAAALRAQPNHQLSPLTVAQELAALLLKGKRHADAEAVCRQAVAWGRNWHQEEDSDFDECLGYLAEALDGQGKTSAPVRDELERIEAARRARGTAAAGVQTTAQLLDIIRPKPKPAR